MKTIAISVRDKVAVTMDETQYICGNSDFIVKFDFDAEWDAFDVKTVRFIKDNRRYIDVVLQGNECSVPIIYNTNKIMVGVFAGNLYTTTPAIIPAQKSILCRDGSPEAPSDDVYAQIIKMIESGILTGPQGEPGTDGKDGSPGEAGQDGKDGSDGVGIASIEQTTTSTADDGSNVFTVTLTNGVKETFTVKNGSKGNTGPKGEDGKDGKDGAEGPKGDSPTMTVEEKIISGDQTIVYHTVKITNPDGSTESFDVYPGDRGPAGPQGERGPTGPQGATGPAGSDANVTPENIETALGYTPAKQADVDRLNSKKADVITPQQFGAKGDGATDDTAAIRSALANHRCVYVPGGTYKLSGELVIRDNCELTLAQDAVLVFTQTTGNCISMKMSASIMGHHATVKVPYGFTGNVIYVDSTLNPDTNSITSVPPWTKWDPQWKAGRYIKDLNICKPDTRGFHYSMDSSTPCSGTAIYMSAVNEGQGGSTFIWGLNFSGIRIAGAFVYGIKAKNIGDGWNHEMRIEAVIEACETAVSLEDCNNAYIAAVVQPKPGMRSDESKFAYAKCGIELIRSKRTDLHGSKVWDWNATNTLWEDGGRYQHIAMIGDCTGTVLDDWLYWAMPGYDIRDLIYTDTPANLEKMTIFQEPITRYFKPIDTKPYFDGGNGEERLVLKSEQDALFETTLIKGFTDQLAKASDGAGGIFNEIGYEKGYFWATNGTTLTASAYHTCTGFIACKQGSVINVKGMSFNAGNDDCRIVLHDSNFGRILHVNRGNVVGNISASFLTGYAETEDGFRVQIANTGSTANVAYITISVYTSTVDAEPAIAVDEEISFTQVGALTSGVKVSETNLIGMEGYEKKGRMTTQVSSVSTDEQYPTAKAVYTALQGALGEYVTDIAALIGGGA